MAAIGGGRAKEGGKGTGTASASPCGMAVIAGLNRPMYKALCSLHI